MSRSSDEELVTKVVAECVSRGLTVSELEGANGGVHRSAVESTVGVGVVGEGVWRREVFPRLLAAMAAAARGASGSRDRVPRCRDCDQPIRWCKTEAGKSLALDPLPHPRGNVSRARHTRRDVMRVHPTRALPLPRSETAYRVHRATCPSRTERPGTVTRLVHRCEGCGQPLHQALVAAGARRHPNDVCDPKREVEL